jgi:hypothetical protein
MSEILKTQSQGFEMDNNDELNKIMIDLLKGGAPPVAQNAEMPTPANDRKTPLFRPPLPAEALRPYAGPLFSNQVGPQGEPVMKSDHRFYGPDRPTNLGAPSIRFGYRPSPSASDVQNWNLPGGSQPQPLGNDYDQKFNFDSTNSFRRKTRP